MALRLAGILCGIGCVIAGWRLARRLRPAGGRAALLAPLLLAVSPILTRHAVSGLETAAYALFFTLGLLLIVCREEQERLRPATVLVKSSILIMLLLLRPEGAVFGALFLLLGHRRRAARLRPVWLVFGLALVAFLLWRWTYFGSLLPNTFHFKMTGDAESWRMGSYYLRSFLRDNGGAILAGFGLALVLEKRPARLLRRCLVVVVLQAAIVIAAGGDWMYHYRFLAPLLPLLAATLAAGVGLVLGAARIVYGDSRLPAAVTAVALVATLSSIYLTERDVWQTVLPAVRQGQYLAQSYARVGDWLRDHTPPGSVIAASDIGAIGYHAERPLIDMLGLVDAHIARTPGGLHGKYDPVYVLSRRPDFVVLVERKGPDGRPDHWRRADQALAAEPGFAAGYRLRHSIDMGYRDEIARIYQRRAAE